MNSIHRKMPKKKSKKTAFEKFVSQNIISMDCFNKWKKSRKKVLKRPVYAFISLISSHVRGTDKYPPFKEEVEEDLLSELRMVNQFGKPTDAYHFLRKFQTNHTKKSISVSALTYKYPYGYYEKRHKTRKKIKVKQRYTKSREIAAPNKPNSVVRNNAIVRTSRSNTLRDVNYSDVCSLYKIFKMGREEIDECLAALAKVDMAANFPAMAYLMEKACETSYYYSREWVLPVGKAKAFREDCIFFVPISRISIFRNTGMLKYMDNNFVNMFGKLKNGFLVPTSLTEHFNVMRFGRIELNENGSIWLRGTSILDGIRYPTMICVRFLEFGVDEVFLQVFRDQPIFEASTQLMLI
eukprot:snap_masked-scaffold_134-processed-gene-0.2-mRNA-1 protein AED:1.00 eAED:1.00 QI:0/0/0/0/1/1/4/0/351